MTKKEKKSIFWKCSPIPDIVRSKLTINSQWVKRYTSSRPNIIVNPLVNNTDNNLRNFTQVWGGSRQCIDRRERSGNTITKHAASFLLASREVNQEFKMAVTFRGGVLDVHMKKPRL